MDLLPDDLLADVLARLPPCSLAASRCVRKHWCAIIDTRRLLRADLLPLRLDGFFCVLRAPRNYDDDTLSVFFSRPSTACRINADLDIFDHCNGFLLLWDLVINPATRQRVPLPPFPKITTAGMEHFYRTEANIKLKESSEWPPSSFTTQVFSSRKWRWEERSFVREGEAAGTIADMRYRLEIRERQAVYLRGALYVHCKNDSVMRITLQNDKYQMIKSPAENQYVAYLGKCERGVYFGLLLEENNWVLKNDISLQAVVENFPNVYTDRYSTPWIVNYQTDVSEVQPEDESDWDFDSGIALHETKDKVATSYARMFFLGFHPYKKIAFFLLSSSRVVSYHLNTSKVQELGILNEFISSSFPYTPCWMGLFENN
ncbi:uncharacterized protein C2845_PM07G22010 [Panicum miliaceum]|uniref:F-box domain-containing protein n=1 Tax=Panicum miliaceum TaxID=4540 RepID=A0A3L6SHG9_PANMI|nr:uncharacterized protein C2845_PM07G22010 [Panicum miliaceum]